MQVIRLKNVGTRPPTELALLAEMQLHGMHAHLHKHFTPAWHIQIYKHLDMQSCVVGKGSLSQLSWTMQQQVLS